MIPHLILTLLRSDKLGNAFKPMQGFGSPNPRLIPTKEEIRLIEEGLPYLRVPFPVPGDAMVRDTSLSVYGRGQPELRYRLAGRGEPSEAGAQRLGQVHHVLQPSGYAPLYPQLAVVMEDAAIRR